MLEVGSKYQFPKLYLTKNKRRKVKKIYCKLIISSSDLSTTKRLGYATCVANELPTVMMSSETRCEDMHHCPPLHLPTHGSNFQASEHHVVYHQQQSPFHMPRFFF